MALTFNSYEFLFLFLPITLLGYYLLRRTRFVNVWLLIASLYFYATGGVVYLIPLIFTCMFDYWVGKHIAPESPFRAKKALFITSVVIQIGLLSVCKYLGWLTVEANHLLAWLGVGASLPVVAFILPPGISFYTFHTISYTADIYRGKFRPHNSWVDYITFVTFFPQLVAGPIARASDLLPQIAAKRDAITWERAESAVWLISWGLFKKIVLADNFGNLVSLIEPQMKTGSTSAGAGLMFAYAFAGQIYCDFSAYTDIARGVAKLFNIELTRNFLTPYLSTSPSDFWRRWHISLSTWLRDYLYIPLGGDRHGRLRTFCNLILTMFLGGLWHGAGIGFIIWGLYHGLLLVFYRTLRIEEYLLSLFGQRAGKWIGIFIMFHLVCIGWIFFRATADQLIPAFQSIGMLFQGYPLDWNFLRLIAWGLLIFGLPLLITEILGYRNGREFVDLYHDWHWITKAAAYGVLFYAIIFFGARIQHEFIYFRF